jgi:hypothetical protein
LPTAEFGIARPEGLAFSWGDDSLLVADARRGQTRVLRLSLLEKRRGSIRLPRLRRPGTLSFDTARQRLAAVGSNASVAVATDRREGTSPTVRRADVSRLGLRDPRSAAFDRAGKTWFILDSGADAIVRVRTRGGSLGQPARIPLARLGARARAIAFHPDHRRLYVLSADGRKLFALGARGAVLRTYDLGSLRLANPTGIVFAPSADPTDPEGALHLYVADRGSASTRGRIVETSIVPQLGITLAEQVPVTHVQTLNTSSYSPSSPDPAGIVYVAATDRFLISDSEVDEMTIYQGKNLFTATRNGTGSGTGTTTAFSREPSGIGHDPSTNTLYVSDDDGDRITVDRPGPDGVHGTSDDVWTRFSMSAFGSTDAEGVEYDTATGHVFVCDGTGTEVYRIDPVNGTFGDGNDVATHFDIGVYGARDCEGIGIDSQRATLLAVDPSSKQIYELSKAGALVRILDLSAIPGTNRNFASVTMAPTSNASDNPSRRSYWIADRQIDNDTTPNENDGKIYEVVVPSTDEPPTVSLTQPAASATVAGTIAVAASASDDNGVTQVQFAVDGNTIGTDTNGADGWSVQWNTAAVPDGNHSLTAIATDTGGRATTSASRSVSVDNVDELPSVQMTAPAEAATVAGTIAVGASASDDKGVTQVRFSVDGTTIATDANGADGWSVQWDTTAVADGDHGLTATATDTAGQTRTSAARAVSVDNVDQSPTVELTEPAESATVAGTIPVRATASDDKGITQVRFSVDGNTIGTDTNASDGWSVQWNTGTVADGAHQLTATATDTGGRTATDSHSVTVDSTFSFPPSVTVTEPAESATVGGTVVVRATASDDVGVTEVRFSVDGTAIGTDTDGADGWSVSWDTGTVSEGEHTVTARATDTQAKTAEDSSQVRVDNTAPTVAVTSPAEGASVSATIAVTASAADAGSVASVRFLVGGTLIGTDTTGADGWSVTWDTTAASNGSHSITAVARDGAGNERTSAAVQFLIDNPMVLSRPISAGADDADELQDGTVARAGGDLELGNDHGVPTTNGLRFTGVSVPRGARITRAQIQFTVDEKGTDASSLNIRAQASDNAGAFASTAFNLSSRPVTSAFTGWSPPQWLTPGTAGADQRTPNLSALVQEVVDRPGWSAGNALAFLVTGSGRRTAESFEGGAPPVLELEYRQP